jgi:hypothetical protein
MEVKVFFLKFISIWFRVKQCHNITSFASVESCPSANCPATAQVCSCLRGPASEDAATSRNGQLAPVYVHKLGEAVLEPPLLSFLSVNTLHFEGKTDWENGSAVAP